MKTWLDVAPYTHYAVRSDGAVFVNGEQQAADTSWLSYDGNILVLGPGVYDELFILPRQASEEEVRSWYQTTVARFRADGDVSIKGELVEGDPGFRYGSDGDLHVNELVEGVSF